MASEYMELNERLPIRAAHDIIVAGGGVAGIAAAICARREGKSVLLIEKQLNLGGLATTGLINLFVPLCNGRGVQIIKGMCEQLLQVSIKYGYDTVPDCWRSSERKIGQRQPRYTTRFSPAIFSLALTELIVSEGVELLLDGVVSRPMMDGNRCNGVVVQTKAGAAYYPAGMIIDATGDGDLLRAAGVPTLPGRNYYTYMGYRTDIESCRRAVEAKDISKASYHCYGGDADLYGKRQPEGVPLYEGTTGEQVTEYIVTNQQKMLDNIRNDERAERDIVILPSMAQFRTTCCIKGEHILTVEDKYRHFEDSIGAICDFDNIDILYEVPYGCLINRGFANIITAGRSAAAEGYAWDVLRVIPPAIVTGQAAGTAAAMAITQGVDIAEVDIAQLQQKLAAADVMIHFDDSLINMGDDTPDDFVAEDLGHI